MEVEVHGNSMPPGAGHGVGDEMVWDEPEARLRKAMSQVQQNRMAVRSAVDPDTKTARRRYETRSLGMVRSHRLIAGGGAVQQQGPLSLVAG